MAAAVAELLLLLLFGLLIIFVAKAWEKFGLINRAASFGFLNSSYKLRVGLFFGLKILFSLTLSTV